MNPLSPEKVFIWNVCLSAINPKHVERLGSNLVCAYFGIISEHFSFLYNIKYEVLLH